MFLKTLLIVSFCIMLASANLTEEQIKVILDEHNKVRNSIAGGGNSQPTGANIAQLQWWTPLQEKAQGWANKNAMGHNPDRKVDGNKQTGENMYWSWNSQNAAFNGKAPVDAWAGEVKDFNSRNVKKFQSVQDRGDTGHYTQVVWASTLYVGCGVSLSKNRGMFMTTVCCNYYPPGNWVGEPIYATGSPASQCKKKSSQYPDLCAPSAAHPSFLIYRGERALIHELLQKSIKQQNKKHD